jgi:serine/threonine protein kinase
MPDARVFPPQPPLLPLRARPHLIPWRFEMRRTRYDGRSSDVWSLGVILHVMLCYKLPFEADSTQLLYKKIRQGLPALPSHLPPAAASLLRAMLEVAPERRIKLVQVGQHEWFELAGGQPPLPLSQTVDAVVDCSAIPLDGDGARAAPPPPLLRSLPPVLRRDTRRPLLVYVPRDTRRPLLVYLSWCPY